MPETEDRMHRTPVVAAGLASALLAPAFAFGQDRTWDWQWSTHPMMFMFGAGGLVMIAIMLVFWGLVIAGLVLGVRWLAGLGHGTGRDEALEILRQRYARGEIDKQEVDTRRRDLGH
jgi:putative membrane protein